jgi:RPA family protein
MTSTTPKSSDMRIIPYTRLFALEMQQTDHIQTRAGERQISLITPSGAKVSKLYFCGVLTEMTNPGGKNPSIRVADPTGGVTFFIKPQNKEVLKILEQITPPAFVSILAFFEKNIKKSPEETEHAPYQCVIERLIEVSRKERDNWIIETADHTMARIEAFYQLFVDSSAFSPLKSLSPPKEGKDFTAWMDITRSKNHYHTSLKQLRVLAQTAANALEQVKPAELEDINEDEHAGQTEENLTDTVLTLIKEQADSRGVEVAFLTQLAKKQGITESSLIETIKILISEDEIYQPSPGFVKML